MTLAKLQPMTQVHVPPAKSDKMNDNNIKQFIAAARHYLLGLLPADTALATLPTGSCKGR